MNDNIEELILSGQFFNPTGRSSSPARSESPSSELGELTFNHDADEPPSTSIHASQPSPPSTAGGGGVGMGVPGRTGVKGVIRDRDEQAQINKEKHAQRIDDLNRQMEKSALVGSKTYLDDERERALEVLMRGGDLRDEKIDALVLASAEKDMAANGLGSGRQGGRFGHLREIGVKGYLNAVEKEDPDVWVVVHLYEPFVDRCYTLDEELALLARQFTYTKFIRCRASALGFASSPSSSSTRRHTTTQSRSTLLRASKPSLFAGRIDEEDDFDDDDSYETRKESRSAHIRSGEYEDDDDDDEEEDEEDDDVDVDTDMLPTMLVYRGSELVFNWVRVDWEAGENGVRELLMRHHVIPRDLYNADDADGRGEDNEVDLRWSDENY